MDREKLIEMIEGKTGSLLSVPYHLISTDDLMAIVLTLYSINELPKDSEK